MSPLLLCIAAASQGIHSNIGGIVIAVVLVVICLLLAVGLTQ